MLTRVIRKLFNLAGYNIVKLPSNDAGKAGSQFEMIDQSDIDELEQGLMRMTELVPDSFEGNRNYISNGRLNFYKGVLSFMEQKVDLSKGRILDMGTCLGYFPYMIKVKYPDADVSGWDYSEEYINQAVYLHKDIAYKASDIYAPTDERFDVIFCMEVLEHLTYPDKALRRLLELTSAGGKLVITVPNGRLDQQKADFMFQDGQGYNGHINFWSPESWAVFLRSVVGEPYQIETGTFGFGKGGPNKNNWAIITKPN